MSGELQERWLDLWDRLCAQGDAGPLFDHLRAQYSEPHRSYHTLDHLAHCLAEFEAARSLARRPEAIEWAIWFHDAIYDPRASANEEQSAHVAETAGRSAGLSESFCRKVATLVRATAHREPPRERDAQILVDVDLSILGQPAGRFDEYERQIREEYSWVPDELFAEKRSAILKSFLRRPTIFSAGCFRERYETPARRNLTRALARWRDLQPEPAPDVQHELPFLSGTTDNGYDRWQQQRREAMHQLARKLNLPLGHSVEVWLRGNIRLRGTLRLREEMIFVEEEADARLQLMVDGVPFSTTEMESCVRQD